MSGFVMITVGSLSHPVVFLTLSLSVCAELFQKSEKNGGGLGRSIGLAARHETQTRHDAGEAGGNGERFYSHCPAR
jgi:hypothetical protein